MAINQVFLLVTKVRPSWQRLLLGWVSCEIGVVCFFSCRLFSILFQYFKAPMWRWNCQTVQQVYQPQFLLQNVLICRRKSFKWRFHSHSALTCELVFEWLKRNWFVPFIALVSCVFLWIIYIPVECDKLRNLCICSNEKKMIFLSFTVLNFVGSSVLTQICIVWHSIKQD